MRDHVELAANGRFIDANQDSRCPAADKLLVRDHMELAICSSNLRGRLGRPFGHRAADKPLVRDHMQLVANCRFITNGRFIRISNTCRDKILGFRVLIIGMKSGVCPGHACLQARSLRQRLQPPVSGSLALPLLRCGRPYTAAGRPSV